MSSVVHRPVAGRFAALGAVFAVFISLLAVPGAVPASAAPCPSASTSTNYSGGAGTSGNPWQIATAADLLRLADPAQSGDWSGYFLQTADIDMAGCDWTPIAFSQEPWGSNAVLFTGTYDGGGRRISSVSLNQDDKIYVGFFGAVDGGTIENLRLQIRIRGDAGGVGGLVGVVWEAGVTIRDVRAEVDVEVDGNTGGLVGDSYGPTLIEGSRVTGSLAAEVEFHLGGLVGLFAVAAPAELVVRDSVSSARLSSASSDMNLGGVLGAAFGSVRITGTTIDGSFSGAGTVRFPGNPPGTINPPLVMTGVGGVIGNIDGTMVEVVISDVQVRASGIAGVEAVGGVVGTVLRLNSLVIERTVVRSPVTASLEFGECLVGSFAAGTEEKTTVVDSFSRSTVSVAGVVSQCPFPPDPEPVAGPSFFAPGGVLPIVSPGLGEWVQADGSSTPLAVSSPAPNQVRYSADGVQVTFTGGAGSDTSRGLVANPNGEVVCEICVALAAGQVIEAWMFSEPRLVAAWRIEDLPCQTFAIPVASPLDGGGPISAGAHTLQLALPTASGMQAVNVGVTVGGPVPARVPAGEGPGVPAGLLLFGVAAAAFGLRRLAVGTAG
jgi:hypothetical protein